MRCDKHKMYHMPCVICQEIKKESEESAKWYNKTKELYQEIRDKNILLNELSKEHEEMETALSEEIAKNVKPERINPVIRNRLFVQDINNVRGFLTAYTFLNNTIVQSKERLETLTGIEKKQWSLLIIELEETYERWVDIKNILINDMSNSNWKRMIKEISAIVDVCVKQMNNRDLGSWTFSKKDSENMENDLKPQVQLAISEALSSAGTNNLTAYSREQLYQKLLKIVEEK